MKFLEYIAYPVIAIVSCVVFKLTVQDIVLIGLLLQMLYRRGDKK